MLHSPAQTQRVICAERSVRLRLRACACFTIDFKISAAVAAAAVAAVRVALGPATQPTDDLRSDPVRLRSSSLSRHGAANTHSSVVVVHFFGLRSAQ